MTVPRLLLVDEHPAVRQGLALMLEAEGLGSCREAGGRAEALDAVSREAPDLALVGLSMDQDAATALVTELRDRRVPVLVHTRQETPAHVKRALAAGARGVVTKDEAPAWLVRAVRDVLAGWIVISPGAADGLDEAAWRVDGPGASP